MNEIQFFNLFGTKGERVGITRYPTYVEWKVAGFYRDDEGFEELPFYTDINFQAPEEIKTASLNSYSEILFPNTLVFAGGHPVKIQIIEFDNLFKSLALMVPETK